MNGSKLDIVKDVIWNIIVYALYFAYCFAMLMLFHLIFFSIIELNWTIKDILIMAGAGSTIMMAVRLVRRAVKRKR